MNVLFYNFYRPKLKIVNTIFAKFLSHFERLGMSLRGRPSPFPLWGVLYSFLGPLLKGEVRGRF